MRTILKPKIFRSKSNPRTKRGEETPNKYFLQKNNFASIIEIAEKITEGNNRGQRCSQLRFPEWVDEILEYQIKEEFILNPQKEDLKIHRKMNDFDTHLIFQKDSLKSTSSFSEISFIEYEISKRNNCKKNFGNSVERTEDASSTSETEEECLSISNSNTSIVEQEISQNLIFLSKGSKDELHTNNEDALSACSLEYELRAKMLLTTIEDSLNKENLVVLNYDEKNFLFKRLEKLACRKVENFSKTLIKKIIFSGKMSPKIDPNKIMLGMGVLCRLVDEF